MPAIQIRESAPYTIGANAGTSELVEAGRYLVTQMVALDPTLSVYDVMADTSSRYEVVIRVANSNVAFAILTTQNYLYIHQGILKSDGTLYLVSSDNSLFFGADSYVKVATAGLPGVLNYIVFMSSSGSEAAEFSYGSFTGTLHADPVYCARVRFRNRPAWPTPPALPVVENLPTMCYNPNTDASSSVSLISTPDLKFWGNDSGYNYCFVPRATMAYAYKSFGNIKWGGQYDLYVLYDANGAAVQTLFGETVTVNGVSMLSGGTVALIE